MGLDFLGRGNRRAWTVGAAHLIGSASGGALIGSIISGIGSAISPQPRIVLSVGIALTALTLSLRVHPPRLGLRRQVPRRWARWNMPEVGYFGWGVMLGMGILTVIPYSSLLVVLGMEMVAGPTAGALAGAAFGLGREIPALFPLLWRKRTDPARAMNSLPGLEWIARKLNFVLAASASGYLMVGLLR